MKAGSKVEATCEIAAPHSDQGSENAAPHSDHGSENAVRAVEFSISPIVDGRATVKARYKGKEKIFLIN